MFNMVGLIGTFIFLSASVYALPPTLVPTNLQTNNFSSFFSSGSMPHNFQRQSNYIVGYVTGPQNGSFILNQNNSELSVHNFTGGGQFVGFGNNRVYGSDRYIELSSRNESLLSLANPPSGFTSFQISAANGNRVFGQYNADQINPSNGSLMPSSSNFFGTVDGNNLISWTNAPSTSADGSFYFKSIFGNYAYGSFMEYDPITNPNSTTKGLIYDITTGNKTLLDVPSTFGNQITAMNESLIYGTYEFIVSEGGSGPGAPGRVLETRGYVYDGSNFFTLALEDQNSEDPYDFASFNSFSVEDNNVIVSMGGSGSFLVGQVPEPSALSLLAVGLGVVLQRRRRTV
jgi:hypothetical protein